METPEIYYKVRMEEEGQETRFEFITKEQARTRGLLQQVLGGDAAQYVKIGPANYELLHQWKQRNRKK